ncbi:MAG: dihydroneopterin aldolase [Paraprevotella sp.]|nr:dihydroneopterin aldolase [Paraprevotella sp.]
MKITSSRILLDNVKIHARHGVDPQEQLTGSYFYVTLEADTNFCSAIRNDRLADTVSYADLFRCVKEEMEIPSLLLEHVAGRILDRIFQTFPDITRLHLRLTKENPPMGADCHQAGIEIEAKR